MKITIFISSMINSGGTERVAANLSAMFTEHGHDVQILVLRSSLKSFYDLKDGVAICSLNIDKRDNKSSKIKYIWEILSGIRLYVCTEKPDVVLAIWTDLAIFSILAGVGLKTKIIACEHISSDRFLTQHESIRNIVYPFADAIVALTERDRKIYSGRNKMSVLIPNAVSLPDSKDDLVRENLVLAVGSILHRKGFDMLIDAWAIAQKELLNWKLLIIGDSADESYKRYLEEKINEHALQDSVKIKSAVKDILAEYNKAKLFILSSRQEGLPMVLMEAMSAGVPVISFDCPTGPRELIQDGYNGVLVENGNVEKLAEAIVQVANNDKLKNTYILNAKMYMESEFSEDMVYHKWLALFATLQLV